MKFPKTMIAIAGALVSLSSCSDTATTAGNDEGFKYLIDEFADIKIMRYRIPEWESLTLKQKEYLYHLAEASKYGRDILWCQNFKYNLEIRTILEKIISDSEGKRSGEEFDKFIVYAKRVFFSNGIHHHYAEDKIIPECSREYMASLMKESGISDKEIEKFIPVIYDADLYAHKRYTGNDKDILLASASNYYDGVTEKEALEFYAAMEKKDDPRPISYGLNSRLVKRDGKLVEEVYKADGLYGKAITRIIQELEAAMKVAENETQKHYVSLLIEYYKSGDLKKWDEYNVAWVRDVTSDIDFVNGFIETYGDPIGLKASWESVVNFKNKKASERTEIISSNAQWFEDNSPVDDRFKKEKVTGVSAKVITAVSLGGDCFPSTPIGINLPNADWIRKEYGSKSVTIENITEAYDKAALESPHSMLSEYAWNEEEIERSRKYGTITGNLHTDLHECLGHGSGQLLPGTSPNALGQFSSTLEEARADLFALYYIADNRMVELGLLPDKEAYKAEYDSFIRNGIFTQFVRVELGKNNTESHMQNRQLIAQWCYEKGLKDNVIEKKRKDGKTYFVINDYGKLRDLMGDLLAEMQRIKSEGDFAAGKALVEKYAVHIDHTLHKEVLERYSALNLRPYGGFVNPEIIPVKEGERIVDYIVEYPDDFLGQMLEYGVRYRTL